MAGVRKLKNNVDKELALTAIVARKRLLYHQAQGVSVVLRVNITTGGLIEKKPTLLLVFYLVFSP